MPLHYQICKNSSRWFSRDQQSRLKSIIPQLERLCHHWRLGKRLILNCWQNPLTLHRLIVYNLFNGRLPIRTSPAGKTGGRTEPDRITGSPESGSGNVWRTQEEPPSGARSAIPRSSACLSRHQLRSCTEGFLYQFSPPIPFETVRRPGFFVYFKAD